MFWRNRFWFLLFFFWCRDTSLDLFRQFVATASCVRGRLSSGLQNLVARERWGALVLACGMRRTHFPCAFGSPPKFVCSICSFKLAHACIIIWEELLVNSDLVLCYSMMCFCCTHTKGPRSLNGAWFPSIWSLFTRREGWRHWMSAVILSFLLLLHCIVIGAFLFATHCTILYVHFAAHVLALMFINKCTCLHLVFTLLFVLCLACFFSGMENQWTEVFSVVWFACSWISRYIAVGCTGRVFWVSLAMVFCCGVAVLCLGSHIYECSEAYNYSCCCTSVNAHLDKVNFSELHLDGAQGKDVSPGDIFYLLCKRLCQLQRALPCGRGPASNNICTCK